MIHLKFSKINPPATMACGALVLALGLSVAVARAVGLPVDSGASFPDGALPLAFGGAWLCFGVAMILGGLERCGFQGLVPSLFGAIAALVWWGQLGGIGVPRLDLLCTAVASAGLVRIHTPVLRRRRVALIATLGSLLTGVSIVALLVRFAGFHASFGVASFFQLGFLSGWAYLFSGIGLLSYACGHTPALRQARWVSIAAAVAMLFISATIWLAIEDDRASRLEERIKSRTNDTNQVITLGVFRRHQAMQRMVERWEAEGGTPREQWEVDARNYMLDFPGLQAIEWADDSGVVRWVVPLDGNEAAVGLDLAFEESRRSILQRARFTGEMAATRSIDLVQGGKGIILLYPIGQGDSCSGYIVSVYKMQEFFSTATRYAGGEFEISVVEEGECVYMSLPPDWNFTRKQLALAQTYPLDVLGNSWVLQVVPTMEYFALHDSGLPELVFAGGLLLTVCFTLVVMLAQHSYRSELELRELNETLEQRVDSGIRDLRSANHLLVREVSDRKRAEDEVRARADELDEFTFMASHDLQEPVRKQQMFSGILQKAIREGNREDAEFALDAIISAAERMRTLVQDLLALSRASRQEIRRDPVAVADVVNEATANLSLRIDETHAEILRDELPTVFGDRTLLVELYQNLISNAMKFQANGAAPRVHVTVERENGRLILGILDNGIGIAESDSARIFSAFKRLHGKHEFEGSGIGLSICRKVVERHGGDIWLESESGEGAHFRFTIPNPGEVHV